VEITNGCGGGGDGGSGDAHGHPRKFVMGRNMHGSCLQITEPELDDKETGEKEAYMSAVLAQYKEILIEKTKFHLGVCVCVCVLCSN
jgi:histidine decarboxylase